MKTVFTICVIIILCTYIAVEKREIRITKEEAYWDAYWDGFRKALNEYGNLPMRPIILDKSTGDIDFKCSCCGHEYIVSEEHKPKYCSGCGRYIDWQDKVYGM